MIYLYIIGTMAALTMVLWTVIVVVASRRVAVSIGTPTPDEARIKEATLKSVASVKAEAEKRTSEVANASGDSLVVDLRNEVRRKP